MQLTLNIDPPIPTPPNSREVILNIMRRKGPCRSVSLCLEPDLPDNLWETFDELVKDGLLCVVGEVRFQGVVPAEHVDQIYAVKESA